MFRFTSMTSLQWSGNVAESARAGRKEISADRDGDASWNCPKYRGRVASWHSRRFPRRKDIPAMREQPVSFVGEVSPRGWRSNSFIPDTAASSDRLGHGRGGNADHGSGSADLSGLRDRDEIANLTKGHRGHEPVLAKVPSCLRSDLLPIHEAISAPCASLVSESFGISEITDRKTQVYKRSSPQLSSFTTTGCGSNRLQDSTTGTSTMQVSQEHIGLRRQMRSARRESQPRLNKRWVR